MTVPNADLFRTLGLFVRRGFLEAGLCARLRAEMRLAARAPATVRTGGSEYLVDPTVRRVHWATPSTALLSVVESRLRAVQEDVGRHFQVSLSGCQPLQFLVYGAGDFYTPHRDSTHESEAPAASQVRKVAAVVFLNGQSREASEDTFCGGALTFYGLLRDPRAARAGLPLEGEEGLLVAFRADTLHGVEPVTAGERYTVATWFF